MGKNVANAGLKTDWVAGIGSSLVFYAHWEDKGVEESTEVTDAKAGDLIRAANTGQVAFNTEAASFAWYAFSSLSTADRTAQREACRKGCLRARSLCLSYSD